MYKFVRAVIGPLARLVFRLKISFEAPLPKEGALILCGKHISAPDPFFAIIACKRPVHYMAKASVFKNPLFRWVLTKMKVYPVKRGVVDKKSYETSVKLLESGEVLGIFPEGTRVHSIDKLRLKSGAVSLAAKTGATVVPFGMYSKDYKVKLFRRTYIRFGKPIQFDKCEEQLSHDKLAELTNTLIKPELERLSQKDYVPQV